MSAATRFPALVRRKIVFPTIVALCGFSAAAQAQSWPEAPIHFEAKNTSTGLGLVSADGKTMVGMEQNDKEEVKSLVIWDASSGKRLGEYPASSWPAAISPRGDLLVRAKLDSSTQHLNGFVLTDTLTGKEKTRLAAEGVAPENMTFAPDGKLLAAACKDNTLRLWNTTTGAVHAVFSAILSKDDPGLVFSPDGKIVIAVGANGSVKRWDLVASKELPEFPASPVYPRRLAYSPDSKLVAKCSGRMVQLLDSTTGRVKTSSKHAYPVTCLAFSPDNNLLATGSVMNERDQYEPSFLKLWELETGRE